MSLCTDEQLAQFYPAKESDTQFKILTTNRLMCFDDETQVELYGFLG